MWEFFTIWNIPPPDFPFVFALCCRFRWIPYRPRACRRRMAVEARSPRRMQCKSIIISSFFFLFHSLYMHMCLFRVAAVVVSAASRPADKRIDNVARRMKNCDTREKNRVASRET